MIPSYRIETFPSTSGTTSTSSAGGDTACSCTSIVLSVALPALQTMTCDSVELDVSTSRFKLEAGVGPDGTGAGPVQYRLDLDLSTVLHSIGGDQIADVDAVVAKFKKKARTLQVTIPTQTKNIHSQ